jgi:transposase
VAHSNATARMLTTVEVPVTLGLDLSDRVSHFCALHGDGRILETGKVKTQRDSLTFLFWRWKGCRLVIEAGGHSPWISRLGKECGLEVVVANPRRVELISKNDRKTDRKDAELLARLGRSDLELLSPITHRSLESQAHLAVRDARNVAVGARTGLINFVRGKLKSSGSRAPTCSPECFGRRALASIPPELKPALRPTLLLINQINRQIKGFDREIERLGVERYPVTQLLQQVPGVGPIVSLAFVLTIDDPKRFKGREVGAYLGMVPRKKSSGQSDPKLHITKAGDREMRRLLVLSANYILGCFGPDCDLKRFGMKLCGDGSSANKKRARVAVARKLAVLLHRLWTTGESYDPLYLAKKRGELAPT